ncbi:MAG: transaldolase [Thermomicrobiales bacterium]|nr:transaldolase [Thermomicrobiales bacterium]
MIDTITRHAEHETHAVAALLVEGQSVWQDDLNRAQLINGALRRAIDEVGVRGLTSNPTIFARAISGGTAYDDQLAALLGAGASPAAAFEAVAVDDVRAACDLFRPLYDATLGGDGFVSVEVSPAAARDPEATREETRRLWAAVARPNVMIKIPGTAEATPVIAEMLAEGININITLLFSLASYERVALAYLAALERRLAAGQPIDRIASVASFFVSRVDTLVDTLLDEKITAASHDATKARLSALKGKAAIANAKLAYARFQEIFASARFAAPRAAGARVQRPLWASTSVKNPAYRDVRYVEALIGPHTVDTMPRATLEAFLDHGAVARTVDREIAEARRVVRDLAEIGIDLEIVAQNLEEEGIAIFTRSYDDVLRVIATGRDAAA